MRGEGCDESLGDSGYCVKWIIGESFQFDGAEDFIEHEGEKVIAIVDVVIDTHVPCAEATSKAAQAEVVEAIGVNKFNRNSDESLEV
jgi:hypothetical protein